jgi:hypothetical protein
MLAAADAYPKYFRENVVPELRVAVVPTNDNESG